MNALIKKIFTRLNLCLNLSFFLFATTNINAQIPTTDVVVVLEELMGLSIEGTELYQTYNDLKTQIIQIEQSIEGNAELQRAAELIRQYNDLVQGSKLNDFSKLTSLVTEFDDFGQGSILGDLLNLNGVGADPNSLYASLSTVDFDDLNYGETLEGYGNLNVFIETVTQDNRKMQIQTALTYFQMSEEARQKAIELDMLLNSETSRSFTAEGQDLGFSSISGLFESLKTLLPSGGALKEMIKSGFGLKGLVQLGDKINNGLAGLFTDDIDAEDLPDEYVDQIFEQHPEFDYDADGLLDNDEYEDLVEYKENELAMEMEEKTNKLSGIFEDLVGGISNLSSIVGDFTIQGEEATLVATDAERIAMMKQRDDYMAECIEYKEKGAQLMKQAAVMSPMETEQRNKNIVNKVSEGLSALGNIGS